MRANNKENAKLKLEHSFEKFRIKNINQRTEKHDLSFELGIYRKQESLQIRNKGTVKKESHKIGKRTLLEGKPIFA